MVTGAPVKWEDPNVFVLTSPEYIFVIEFVSHHWLGDRRRHPTTDSRIREVILAIKWPLI